MKVNSIFLAISLIFSIHTTQAFGASNWSQKPGWANSKNRSYYGNKTQPRKRESMFKPTPFSPGSNNLGIEVGQVFLMGDLSDAHANSLGMQLHYTYGVSDMFAFDSSFGYSSHDGDLSIAHLLTGLRTNLSWFDKIIPYFVFGLGFYKPSIPNPLIVGDSVSPILFGVHIGPGVNLQLTDQLFFGASITFHDMFGSDEIVKANNGGQQFTQVVEVDGTFTSFLLNAGVTF